MTETNTQQENSPTQPEEIILQNQHYEESIRLKAELEAEKEHFSNLLNTDVLSIDSNTLYEFYQKVKDVRNITNYAGRRSLSEIQQSLKGLSGARGIRFEYRPPNGYFLKAHFKGLVLVDQLSLRKACRLPPAYFEAEFDGKHNFRLRTYTTLRTGWRPSEFDTPYKVKEIKRPDGMVFRKRIYERKTMVNPHCYRLNYHCLGTWNDVVYESAFSYNLDMLICHMRDFFCGGGGHGEQMAYLMYGDPNIRLYSPDEMRLSQRTPDREPYSGSFQWCETYSRWGYLLRLRDKSQRFYISPNEWLPVPEGMVFSPVNVDQNRKAFKSLYEPLPDVRNIVQLDKTIPVPLSYRPLYHRRGQVILNTLPEKKIEEVKEPSDEKTI